MKKITKTLLESLKEPSIVKEASDMESTIDEAARYLFDEGDSDYLPDWEEFKDYTMDISKPLFDKAKERALKALTTLAEHNYVSDNKTYLELSDNHTIFELNNEDRDLEDWVSIIENKFETFEQKTGTEIWQAGRSGRHIVVEPTYDNCMNYDYLKEVQEALEQEAIQEFNTKEEINESVSNNYYLPYYAGDENDCEEEAERLKDMGFTKEYNVKIIVRKAINTDTGKEDSKLYSVDFIGSKPALLNVARNFPILSEFGNETEFNDMIYREDSRLQESTENKTHKMNSIKYNTNGYTEATDGYYKGKPIVNYKEKDFKKGTSVLMPFICDSCGKEFYVKSSIHDFFEQGDFDDPYEVPKENFVCPKCKEDSLSYNGEVLIKEPGAKKEISEDVSINNDPDLNAEQVKADVDYWTDVDESNTEDVSNMEPSGVYSVSNNYQILVYEIKYDINDSVLAGDSSDTTKAKWRDIIFDDGDPYFYYGDIKVPFNEVMRTNI